MILTRRPFPRQFDTFGAHQNMIECHETRTNAPLTELVDLTDLIALNRSYEEFGVMLVHLLPKSE